MNSIKIKIAAALAVALALVLTLPLAIYAAETVTGSITPSVTISGTNTIASGQVIQTTIKLPGGSAPISFASGTGAAQISVKWADTRTYAVSTPVTLDLTTLASASTNTGAASFAKIKVIAIFNNEAAASGKDLIIGGNVTTPFYGPLAGTLPTYTIKPGCAWIHYDLTAGGLDCSTNKLFKIDPGANAVSASVVFAGN